MAQSPLKIGPLGLENNLIFAPLAGITNLPMRLMARQAGCGLVCSEMISANALYYKTPKTFQLLESVPEERPLSVQIFGADPAIMAEAAQMVAATGADILDINFGCSVKKVVKTGSGVALMRTPELARKILVAVRRVIAIPLTIKIRSGWENSGCQAYEIARIAEECGVDAVAFHPRTATQGFSGKADWSQIAHLKEMVRIPVIGNGDIVSFEDALRMKHETGCDGMMIGRAAIGNPFIFQQIAAAENGKPVFVPDFSQRIDILRSYLDASVVHLGEFNACRMMRSRMCWFVKGMPRASQFRESIRKISSRKEAHFFIDEFQNLLESRQ